MIQEPVQPTPTPARARRYQGTTLRLAIVIVVCLVLAVPVVVAMATAPDPLATLTVGASTAPESSGRPAPSDRPGKSRWGDGNLKGDKGLRGLGRGPITIRAIDRARLSLATDDGWTRTIEVGAATTVTKGGVPITVADLEVGDVIGFRQTRNADGSYTVTAITVPTPRTGGDVSAVAGNAVTLTQKGGTTRVITLTDATVYKLGRTPGTRADVKVGTKINATGTVSGDTFTAISVTIRLARTGGEVTATSSDRITVKDRTGKTTVIHVTAATAYRVKGKGSGGALSDIAVGDRVIAQGTMRADGSLDAVGVHAGSPRDAKPDRAPAASAAPG